MKRLGRARRLLLKFELPRAGTFSDLSHGAGRLFNDADKNGCRLTIRWSLGRGAHLCATSRLTSGTGIARVALHWHWLS